MKFHNTIYSNDLNWHTSYWTQCKCGWFGNGQHLKKVFSVEVNHPLNKDKKPGERMYRTLFESCPSCNRDLYADGEYLQQENV